MKRFKLIKEYPGSAGLGTIITFDTNHNKYVFLYTGNDIHFYNRAPEDYPEFWEEVIEKDYEILSFINSYNDLCNRLINGNFTFSKDTSVEGLSESFMIKSSCKIHSVRRLSDGEVFTVGDKIKIHNKIGSITYFTKDLWAGIEGIKCNGPYKISLLNKVKQSLFTTEDSVDIYEGETCFFVRPKLLEKVEVFKCTKDFWQGNLKLYKGFSTKKAAEEYIIMNKPCLSLNDLVNSSFDDEDVFEELIIKVKEKLKL